VGRRKKQTSTSYGIEVSVLGIWHGLRGDHDQEKWKREAALLEIRSLL
jgi:hypothetical protein